ncbi:MAG: hypothetical protein Fur0037_05110 [Planctomycetota bacterium]
MHNTSRVDDEPYPRLLQEKGFSGFPSLCFMDAEGNVLLKQGERSVAGFENSFSALSRRAALAEKAAKGDAKAEKELFLVDLDLGTLSAEQIEQRAKKLTLTKEEKQRVDQALTDAEVSALLRNSRRAGAEETAAKIAQMARDGRRPSKSMTYSFWSMALRHAATEKDAKLADQAYAELEDLAKADRLYERVLKQLAKLREQAREK